MVTAVVIPARGNSSRFSGKPLAKIGKRPMIEWVVRAACSSKRIDKVIVATDNERIFDFVSDLSKGLSQKIVEPCMTSKEHKCGTDRIAEVVRQNSDIELVVNLQGDEPLMPPEYIDKVVESIKKQKDTSTNHVISTLAAPITLLSKLNNPDVVKVVLDKNNYALYFSRAPIPYNRSKTQHSKFNTLESYYHHIGIYGYTRESLLLFSELQESKLEQLEQLEQLRALENGFKIKVEIVPKAYPAIDRAEDIKAVEEAMSYTAQ